ncbi:DUF1295 domain-containing protein [Bacillaceae bacterium IKA-2]|nr:DUF1295 domain-containing protein [Bacillaceae bacterium IKA-2]
MLELYLYSTIAIFIYMVIIFIIAQVKIDNSIVDIAWGIGFVIVSFVSLFYTQEYALRQMLVVGLVTVWGVRLALFIWYRSIGKGEDFRYVNFRKNWGDKARSRAFFKVFMLQGAILLVLAYPILRVHASPDPGIDLFMFIGSIMWLIGFLFQAVGDQQLERFKRTKIRKEQILKTGLWRYSRHPNYFGEVLMWWGIFVIIFPVNLGWTAGFSALLITTLLLRVSGVPLLDKRYKDNADYQQYKKETNNFIPWFPKQ